MDSALSNFHKEKKFIAILLLPMTLFYLYDLLKDWSGGAHSSHLLFEVISVVIGVGLTVWLWISSLNKAYIINQKLSTELKSVQLQSAQWREEAYTYMQGLGKTIDSQFDRWNLTLAEKEVGLLLLKGMSYKEIADIRNTTERTVKEQASAVYQKTSLNGRAQLSAFFLEDLLLPTRD